MDNKAKVKTVVLFGLAIFLFGTTLYHSFWFRGFCIVFIPLFPPLFWVLYIFHIRHMKFITAIISPSPVRPKPEKLSVKIMNPFFIEQQ